MADAKSALCLWLPEGAEEAARFWCELFPDSEIIEFNRSPTDWPGGKAGDVLTVDFTLLGQRAMAMNGNPSGGPNDAISIQVFTDSQEETDRYWEALTGNGGGEMACSWCYDRWGVRWQVVPRVLMQGLGHENPETRTRVFAAMQQMIKIDHAGIEAALKGD